ncbi:probable glycosyltransferase At5g03795 [Pistacia vera]|uniref:probable glycosyltransferase At5g03795 n=1 Tax=Pistacia vera TaxID=55513 RepID=UPI001263BFDF|nr:probable glycosyltransferase At5g03795 [Pistacia vera]
MFISRRTKIILQRAAFFMMRDLLHCSRWLSIGWRKLIFAGAIVTMAGFVLHIWLLSQPVTVLSHSSLNGSIQLSESLNVARTEQFQHITATPIRNSSVQVIEKMRKRRRGEELKVIASPPLPPPATPPSRLQRHIWTLSSSEALVFAKREIQHAPVNIEDPELYAPVFQNVSVFKRSYELMEMILKVYVYREGKRPIFHQPQLKGIYASEGWFMKLMEANSHFVTRDPGKAHLFYLPYSVYQLGRTLYKPNSHDIGSLANHLRDWVNFIAAKYPFWNRTHGSDHFFVACHDWGPYTTTSHKELKENAIKALCNADTSEGIFKAGHDVSLPETTIRTPRRPHRYIGARNRVSQRPILAFFAGFMHGRVRPILLKYWRKDEDMKIHGRLPVHVARNMSYIQHMKSSKYCICPMGFEVNSPRIVESIYYECVPVIIADNFVLPLSEVLDWSAFSIVVAEKDIPKLKEILLAIPLRKYLRMQANVKMVQKHFFWNPIPVKYDLFHMILHSIWVKRLSQIQDVQSL